MRTMLLAFSFAAMAAVSASGAQLSDTYVVPAAAHATGAGGETWQTDLSIFNPSPAALIVDVQLVPAGGADPLVLLSGVNVAAQATFTMRDVVAPAGGVVANDVATGALIVSGNHAFALSARAVAVTSAGSASEAIEPAGDFVDGTTRDSFIAGLTANGNFRSNIGFFAAAARTSSMRVTVTLLGADGTALGSRDFDIAAGGVMQSQLNTRELSAATFDAASARVSVVSGEGILTSYGSVVDNRTSVGMFISGAGGVLPPTAAGSLLRTLWR